MVWGEINNHSHYVGHTINNNNIAVSSSASKSATIHNTILPANKASSGYAAALLNRNSNTGNNKKTNYNNKNNTLHVNNPNNHKLGVKQETKDFFSNDHDNNTHFRETKVMQSKIQTTHPSTTIIRDHNQTSESTKWRTVLSSSTWNDRKPKNNPNDANPNLRKDDRNLKSTSIRYEFSLKDTQNKPKRQKSNNNNHNDNMNTYHNSNDKRATTIAHPKQKGPQKKLPSTQRPPTNNSNDKRNKNKKSNETTAQKKIKKPPNKKNPSVKPKKQNKTTDNNNSKEILKLMDFPALTSNTDFPNLSQTTSATSPTPNNLAISTSTTLLSTISNPPPSSQSNFKKSSNNGSAVSKKTSTKKPNPSPKKKNAKNTTVSASHTSIEKTTVHHKNAKAKGNINAPSLSLLSKTISKSNDITTINKHLAVDNFISLPTKNVNTGHIQLKTQGRQRLGPKKKRLTTLKKRVLQERLAQYRQANNLTDNDNNKCVDPGEDKVSVNEEKKSHMYSDNNDLTLCVLNFISGEDELQDEDEYEEMCADLQDLAQKVGPVEFLWIPRAATGNNSCYLAFVKFHKLEDAQAAHSIWEGMMIAGNRLEVHFVRTTKTSPQTEEEWQEQVSSFNPPHNNDSKASCNEKESNNENDHICQEVSCILLEDILTEDDYEDEECLEESIQDIIELTSQFGAVVKEGVKVVLGGAVWIPFNVEKDSVKRIITSLKGMKIGGSNISAKLLQPSIILGNIFTEDDYDDEDCFEETKQDIQTLLEQTKYYGANLTNVGIRSNNNDTSSEDGQIIVSYDSFDIARLAAQSLNDNAILGGCQISAKVNFPTEFLQSSGMKLNEEPFIMIMENIFTEDDLEDEDCLEETKEDMIALASKYGKVLSSEVQITEIEKNHMSITYELINNMNQAISEINGMVIGGQTIIAYSKNKNHNIDSKPQAIMATSKKNISSNNTVNAVSEDKKVDDPPPIYSGEKIIPEKYAACKRVPKIPNKGVPREYALSSRIDDENAVPLIFEMLGELMRLQIRNKDDKNARARRRLVMGFREVARGIRAHKIKMVIMANNLDEYGAIDSKLQSILDMAKEDDLPVIFELNKRKLGKALGKSIKVGIVGIQNADGAHEPFKKLKKLMGVY